MNRPQGLPQLSMHPLRLMDELEQISDAQSGYTGSSRWMIPYADLLTLLLGFFIVMFAIAQKPESTVATQQPEASATGSQGYALAATEKTDVTLEKQVETFLGKDAAGMTVTRDERGVVLSVEEKLMFAPGSASLTPESQTVLRRLTQLLRENTRPIRVEGHTDNTPIQTAQFPSNWELSTARATNLLKRLVQEHHIAANRLSAAGYGEFHPVADNSTKEGKQKNRRVDIVLLDPRAGT